MMNISKFFEDKYTILFALLLVLLVSIWISRTYRNGGFGGWISPAEGYGTGVIEGFTGSLMLPDASNERTYCNMVTGTIISEVGIPFSLTTAQAMPAAVAASVGPPPVSAIPAGEIYVNFPTGYFVPLLSTDAGTLTAKLFTNDGVRVDTGAAGGTITFDPANAPTRLKYVVGGGAAVPAGTYVLKIYNLKLGAAVDAGTGQTGTITVTTSTTGNTTVLDILHPAIASNKKDPRYPESCRKMKVNPVVKVYIPPYEATLPKVSSPVYIKLVFTLTNTFSNGDKFVVQIPELLQSAGGVNITTARAETTPASTSFTSGTLQYSAANINAAASHYSKTNITFIPTLSSAIPAGTQITLEFGGLTTPATEKPQVNDSQIVAIQTINSADIMYERGIYSFPAITGGSAASPASSSSSSSGTASDGTTYVTAAASSVLISDVKRQSEWAIKAQKAYEAAWTKLRNASASEKTAAQDAYDVAVKIRNRLIASHPDSWFDGSAWRYGDDGYIKKCIEPSTLSSNEGNCQNIFKTDMSGNLVKSADGNNILLMKKCPWKCNNPGQSGSDACRIDADCAKVIRWATYLPDGSQIEKNLLSTSRSSYDEIASISSGSPLAGDETDIYRRGVTRNFNKYGRSGPGGPGGEQRRGLFGGIRDAAGNVIRSVGNWIDPDDAASNKRTNKHNAYYYEDGTPAATAYLGQYNGQSYEDESVYSLASRPTNYYYTDGAQDVNDGKSNNPNSISAIKPYEPAINL